MKMKKILLISIIVSTLFILTACIPGDGTYTTTNPAGFFWGIWHGWVAPFSLILGFFKHDIRVYEIVNTGWWYDFGFYMAVISGFGGLSLLRKKNNKRD